MKRGVAALLPSEGATGCGGGPETQLHDILWAVHDGKNHGRSEGEENFGEFPVTVGGRGLSDARFSRTRARVCARRWL